MPWRETKDPYAIWVSEVMLQQTRVETVLAYYRPFLAQFPTLSALADAPMERVLKVWEGLGYYRRARHLHKAARAALQRWGGFPPTYEAFRELPGVGPYTAAAVFAIAFGERRLPLDGNLRRVLSRWFDLNTRRDRVYLEHGEPLLEQVPEPRVSDWVQALMDLGAKGCTPRTPNGASCPVRRQCLAYQRGTVALRPPPRPRRKVPHVRVAVVLVRRGARVLVGRRKQDRMLGGLWELPGGKVRAGETPEAAARRELFEETGIRDLQDLRYHGHVRHTYTHLSVELHTFSAHTPEDVRWVGEAEELRWVLPEDLHRLTLPRGTQKVLHLLKKRGML
ncbi:MAG: A/G-specific adenine glycosylase [Candidatus Hydrothermae bacterium]|nr:A/G-specific adenine glycosylase [Candidatus Hydrothermae bacterium]